MFIPPAEHLPLLLHGTCLRQTSKRPVLLHPLCRPRHPVFHHDRHLSLPNQRPPTARLRNRRTLPLHTDERRPLLDQLLRIETRKETEIASAKGIVPVTETRNERGIKLRGRIEMVEGKGQSVKEKNQIAIQIMARSIMTPTIKLPRGHQHSTGREK